MIGAPAWGATLGLVAALFALDVLVAGPRTAGARSAVLWSLFYVAVALGYGLVIGVAGGWDLATQFLAGYVVEKSLSVDNLFVFLVIIGAFAVPAEHQARALSIGIAAALAMRAVLIAVGAALLQAFSFTFAVFGALLILTAVHLFRHRHAPPPGADSAFVGLARRHLPVSDRFDGTRLTVRRGGRRLATPMLLVLVAIGGADALFALDSIPAVYGVTSHPLIVFSANALALLGLRSLFFVVADLVHRLVHLATAMPVILGFIGVKLCLEFAHAQTAAVPAIPTWLSLVVIVAVLGVAVVASLRSTRAGRPRAGRAHSPKMRSAPHGRAGEAARP